MMDKQEELLKATVESGVWQTQEQEDQQCDMVIGYVPSMSSAQIIKAGMEAKGYVVTVDDGPTNYNLVRKQFTSPDTLE